MLTEDTAPHVQCKYVVEAANGPTTPGGDAVLRQRGITVLPDIYVNAGRICMLMYRVLKGTHGVGVGVGSVGVGIVGMGGVGWVGGGCWVGGQYGVLLLCVSHALMYNQHAQCPCTFPPLCLRISPNPHYSTPQFMKTQVV